MKNWLVNLNCNWKIEIWKNCWSNGRAAIGWDHLDDANAKEGFKTALKYLREMQRGDRIVAFLKGRRLGGWGTITKGYDPKVREPQLGGSSFSRVVQVQWQENGPPFGRAARMKAEDVRGFNVRSTINRLGDEAFERLKGIVIDKSRWEPIAELAEKSLAEDEAVGESEAESQEPVRESELRRILAHDLSQIEHGLIPFDPKRGAEEFKVEKAGRFDLFCRDKDGNPVVVELKKGMSSDRVAGQLARYMGYVTENLLKGPGKRVRGIVVCHKADERLRLALKAVPNSELRLYDVRLMLRRPEEKRAK